MFASSGGAFVAGGVAAHLGNGQKPPAVPCKGVSFDSARGLDLMTPPSEKKQDSLDLETEALPPKPARARCLWFRRAPTSTICAGEST